MEAVIYVVLILQKVQSARPHHFPSLASFPGLPSSLVQQTPSIILTPSHCTSYKVQQSLSLEPCFSADGKVMPRGIFSCPDLERGQ